MSLTPNFGFNIPDSTDIVNLLTQCYPNFNIADTALQAIKETGVTQATESKAGTVHNIARTVSACSLLWFTATSNFTTGDTFTVDGSPVSAVKVSGAGLETGDFVINSNVLAIVKGSVLTVLAGGGSSQIDASDVDYDNTSSGLTATNVQDAVDELAARPVTATATDVTYDNTVSGLTATDVQAAIDELKALIPVGRQYITTGLSISNNRCVINDGGYAIENGMVYVDITVTTLTSISSDYGMVTGFPQSTAVSSGDITPAFNGAAINFNSGDVATVLVAKGNKTTGVTIHFIGSYQLKQI